MHGSQSYDPRWQFIPLAYYNQKTSIGQIFGFLDKKRGPQKVAVVGLGAGATACHKKSGRTFDYFEINPLVISIAENTNLFTYLSGCGSPYRIIPGDGRLTMQNMPDDSYDLILIDAFASDNIPVHLLTVEAIELYLKKLKPKGILAFHISNNYLYIEPVLARAAEKLDIPGYDHTSLAGKIEGTDLEYYSTNVFSMSENAEYLSYLQKQGWVAGKLEPRVRLWTDNYSNVLSIMSNKALQYQGKSLKGQTKSAR